MIQTADIMIEIEDKFKLFDLKLREFNIWWMSRRIIFNTIEAARKSSGMQKKKKPSNIILRLTMLKYLSSLNFKKNMYSHFDILCLSDTATRIEIVKNKKFDILFDYIGMYDDKSYAILDTPSGKGYEKNAYTKNSYNLSNMTVLIHMYRQFYRLFLKEEEIKIIRNVMESIEKYLLEKYQIDIKISSIVLQNTAVLFRGYRIAYSILSKINPKAFYVQCAYSPSHLLFVYAAKALNIKVIEFQHGLISKNHFGYIFNKKIEKNDPVPDYICVWGSYFKRLMEKMNPKSKLNIIEYGHPYVHKKVVENINNQASDKEYDILITTQGIDTSSYWMNFIEELTNIDTKLKILVKVHPNEVMQYREIYRSIIGREGVTFSNFHERFDNVYECLKVCKSHVSCFSTCHYEALACNIPTFVVKFPKWENAEDLQNYGVSFVDSPEELLSKLKEVSQDILFDKFKKDFYNIEGSHFDDEDLKKKVVDIDNFFTKEML